MKVKSWAIITREPDYSPLKQFLGKKDLEKKTFKVAGIQYLAKSGMCIFKKINTSNSGISTCNYGIIKLVPYE